MEQGIEIEIYKRCCVCMAYEYPPESGIYYPKDIIKYSKDALFTDSYRSKDCVRKAHPPGTALWMLITKEDWYPGLPERCLMRMIRNE